MYKLVLLRHGESVWNQENRFTGWTDVPLTDKGRGEAARAATHLKEAGLLPDVAFTSLLKRAINTLWIVLEGLDRMWIPVTRSWRLNERHYGALQGLNKAETAAKHGDDQVLVWRRSYDTPPPPLEDTDERHPSRDARYADIDPAVLPRSEALLHTVERFLPYWVDAIVPQIRQGKQVMICAHGNSLRALVKYLDGVSEEEIVGLNIPTGMPLVYELDANLRPTNRYFLGDPDEVAKAQAAVANQGKAQA